jgi:hypothetical protein
MAEIPSSSSVNWRKFSWLSIGRGYFDVLQLYSGGKYFTAAAVIP